MNYDPYILAIEDTFVDGEGCNELDPYIAVLKGTFVEVAGAVIMDVVKELEHG